MRNHIVLDSNLVVSAFLSPHGTAARALILALENFEIVCSKEVFEELLDVLNRDKFDRYSSKEERMERLIVYGQSVLFFDVYTPVTDCRDPKDNKFLSLALTTNSKLIVSGDKKDLISMNPYRGIPIIGLRDFVENFKAYL